MPSCLVYVRGWVTRGGRKVVVHVERPAQLPPILQLAAVVHPTFVARRDAPLRPVLLPLRQTVPVGDASHGAIFVDYDGTDVVQLDRLPKLELSHFFTPTTPLAVVVVSTLVAGLEDWNILRRRPRFRSFRRRRRRRRRRLVMIVVGVVARGGHRRGECDRQP